MLYLDASAVVKLVRRETHSRELFGFVRERRDLVTSAISAVEVSRAIRRADPRLLDRATRILGTINQLEVDHPIRRMAARLDPASLRTLDAIHVATALELGRDLEAIVTYDQRQGKAARSAGLEVLSPGRPD